MKNYLLKSLICIIGGLAMYYSSNGQGMHFSQYYNAPMLLNPANTALMPVSDYQAGVNYRQQWASVPVPYITNSFFANFQAFRNRHETNWMGLGLAVFNDKTGDGELSLTRVEGFLAYHIRLNEKHMISAGVSTGPVQRAVNFSRFIYDEQWDGFGFSGSMPSGETGQVSKTRFIDVGAGVNYAYMPNEDVYMKVGLGLAHVNTPVETFYGQDYRIGMRPTANVDILFKAGFSTIINPSIYYTSQKNAYELVYGTIFNFSLFDASGKDARFLTGLYHRWDDAIIGVAGLQYSQVKLTASYDFTISSLSPANTSKGGYEVSLIYENIYGTRSKNRNTYRCPKI